MGNDEMSRRDWKAKLAKRPDKDIDMSYEEPHTHCWHRDSHLSFTSYPAQWNERCCWCGATRRAREEFVTPEGHGPHAPKVARTVYDG